MPSPRPSPSNSSDAIPGRLSVLHAVAPARVGGLESVVRSLVAGLRGRGHDARVAAIIAPEDDRHPWCEELRANGVPVDEVRVRSRAYLAERSRVRSLCVERHARILHSHGYRADVVDSGVARAIGVARVTTVHGRTGGGWRNRLYERLQGRAFRSMDAVVAVSRPLERELRMEGVPGERLHLLPNAFSPAAPILDRMEARDVLRLSSSDAEMRIGWVGRLSAEKGLDVLLDALTLLPLGSVQLSVIGTGSDEPSLRQRAAELGLAPHISWHGNVFQAGSLFRAFDLFVLSSRTEGTPIVLLEAMAAGVPIVATTVGGVPDVVGEEEAFLVPPVQPAALAAAIERALSSPAERERRVAAAARRLSEAFGMEPWLDAYERVYRSALTATAPRS
ncbi:MAG TPA: glycosyltransferase family 4 protein [Gemmatimonadaceae bacterium]|nr:glycosyltransferase family 4 protein [Gemmatimonadaceae bacterium]